jgi:hypothetical protein
MQSSTKRSGIAVVVAVGVAGALFVLATMAGGANAKPVAVVVAPGPRAAVMAKSVGDWPSSTLTATTAAQPVAVTAPVTTSVASTTTLQAPSKRAVGGSSAASGTSGLPPIPVGVPTPISVPLGPPPVTTTLPTLPTTTLPTNVASASHIIVTVQIDPPSPRVGETVNLTLRASGGAWCCTPVVYFSDGTPPWIPFGPHDTGPCPSLSGTPSGTYTLTHVFAAPGVFAVQGEADGGSTCLAPPNFEWVYGRSSTTVTVSP